VTRLKEKRSKTEFIARETPVIVIDKGQIRGVFATQELAVEFTSRNNCPYAILFRDDGRGDLGRFRGESPR